MKQVNFENLSNSEIKLHMKAVEQKHDVLKNQVLEQLSKLKELDEEYRLAQQELNKRRIL